MEFLEAKEIMKQKMGDWKIMALASCELPSGLLTSMSTAL